MYCVYIYIFTTNFIFRVCHGYEWYMLVICGFPGCERGSSVSMWIYVFLGNVLRGIGETPVQPLGISYIDDYAQSENAAFYIGKVFSLVWQNRFHRYNRYCRLRQDSASLFYCSTPGCVQTISVIGPVFGYLLGSICAKIYVDFEHVETGEEDRRH